MSNPQPNRVPSCRRHKPSGQAVVTLDGRDHYLGPWRSKRSKTEYERLIGEWLTNGRQLPSSALPSDLTITEVIARYIRFAKGYYRKNGLPTTELNCIRESLRLLRRIYGHCPACEFGPLSLKALRDRMIAAQWTRSTVNGRVNRVKRMFKWAVENELVQPEMYHGLQAVCGLRKGRSEARESDPVRPVADSIVDATLRHLPPTVAAMIEL